MAGTNATPGRVRVLIADCAELVRRGIRGVLTRDRQFTVVGEVARPEEIAQVGLDRSPDLIFFGLRRDNERSPNRSESLAALRETLRLDPFAAVIVLIDGEVIEELLEAVRAGASGVLLRDAPADELLDAARHVLEGGGALDPRLTKQLFQHLASELSLTGGWSEPTLDPAALRSLSPREQEVLRLLCQGQRNKEIAAQLGVTVGTVKTHLRHIFRKLKVYDRTGAILTAFQVSPPRAA